MWSSIIPLIFKSLPSKAPIIVYVPASILSGITSITPLPSFSTPSITISLVPAPRILAPILFNNEAMLTISGSLAAFEICVVPSAFTAANIMLIVAPTEAKSK